MRGLRGIERLFYRSLMPRICDNDWESCCTCYSSCGGTSDTCVCHHTSSSAASAIASKRAAAPGRPAKCADNASMWSCQTAAIPRSKSIRVASSRYARLERGIKEAFSIAAYVKLQFDYFLLSPFCALADEPHGARASLRGRRQPPHDGMRRMGRYNLTGALLYRGLCQAPV